MKRVLTFFLVMLLCLCLVACDKNKNGAQGAESLSGETVWLPSVITYIGADGTRYDMQTIEMEGNVAKISFYGNYNGNTYLSAGYEMDLSKTSPLELVMLHNSLSKIGDGLRRFAISEDGTLITEDYAYELSQGIDSVTTYDITYDDQGRIEKVIIKDQYKDNPAKTEIRLYEYGETGYTISYTDASWSETDDDGTKVLRHYVYEIPYEGDKIVVTESYRTQEGGVHYPDDFHTYSDQKVDKLVYEVNRQGFCTANTLYFKNGTTESNQDFFGGLRFTAEFNENGMPTKFVSTSKDGSDPHTSTYTYDDNGNLVGYHEESSRVNFSCELQWAEYPAELYEIFAAVFNCSNFSIREVIEDNCPEILLGPQELIYQKEDICG